MKVRFLNLSIQDQEEKQSILAAVERVLDHGIMIHGPEVEMFEKKFAEYVGRKYAVAVNSGTDSLIFALKALGICHGDEIITTSLSWIATANAIAICGAIPVFADICDDLNIDVTSVERLISNKTKAIMPVHFAGRVCEMKAIQELAKKHNLLVIEDASQAVGAKYYNQLSGSLGDIGCFSLNPMKVFGACGEAGVLVTDSEEIKEKLEILRYNGTINKETCIEVSINGRIDTLQAAILLERFNYFEKFIQKRRDIMKKYNEHLSSLVKVPLEKDYEMLSCYNYTIQTPFRNSLKEYLEKNGIEIKIQHPILMPNQPAYEAWTKSDKKNATKIVQEIMCLPASEKLLDEEQEYIIDLIKKFFKDSKCL